jgi:hypothetical protein
VRNSEILSEIDLPQSGVAYLGYVNTFPQPPDSDGADENSPRISISTGSPDSTSRPLVADVIRRERQQSWFYYLSEIALRRIGNRVLNHFYQDGHKSWTKESLESLMKAAREFLRQLNQWYDCLPSPVRYNEQNSNEIPSEELPYMLRTRAIEIRSWVLRPFLFRAIHCSPDNPQRVMLSSWVEAAIRCCIQLIEANSLRHRHHGTWYVLRVSTASALSLYAAGKSGLAPDEWVPTVRLAIETLLYWENEGSREIHKARLLLQDLVAEFGYSESAAKS